MRQSLPRDQVPPVTTELYLQGWTAIIRGDLTEATTLFTGKLASLDRG